VRRSCATSPVAFTAAIAAIAVVVALAAPRSAAFGADRPNVLIVLVDQEAPALQLPPLARPNLDRLAARGLTFTRAYAAYPVCSSSRAALLTGLYPHQNGVLENVNPGIESPPLDPALPTLGPVFARAGWSTAWFGKWHLSLGDDAARYGFEHVFKFPKGQQGKDGDPQVVASAAEWIRARPAGQPWLAVVSVLGPHDIAFPELYEDVKIPDYPVELPASQHDDLTAAGRAPELQANASWRNGVKTPHDDADWIRYLRLYCHLLERTDGLLGGVLDALDSRPDAERTIVVYTSDHGEMGGAHGMAQKRFLYEESVRIRLVMAGPGVERAASSDRVVSNVDLAPTLAAMAGVTWPTPLPGRNLFAGGAASTGVATDDEAVFSEVSIPSTRSGAERATHLTRMVRTHDWKYVLYPSGAEELYDTASDPSEVHDLGAAPEQAVRRAELRRRLDAWLAATPPPRSPSVATQ
jgi:arylsulfatase A-like enzyme